MGEDNHLPGLLSQSSDLVIRGDNTLMVKTRNWVIEDDNYLAQVRVLVKGGKEEGKSQGGSITSAESIAKGGLIWRNRDFSDSDRRVVNQRVICAR